MGLAGVSPIHAHRLQGAQHALETSIIDRCNSGQAALV
jgi:hypothetical protein